MPNNSKFKAFIINNYKHSKFKPIKIRAFNIVQNQICQYLTTSKLKNISIVRFQSRSRQNTTNFISRSSNTEMIQI